MVQSTGNTPTLDTLRGKMERKGETFAKEDMTTTLDYALSGERIEISKDTDGKKIYTATFRVKLKDDKCMTMRIVCANPKEKEIYNKIQAIRGLCRKLNTTEYNNFFLPSLIRLTH